MAATAESVRKPDFNTQRKHFIFTDEHEQLRESIRSFAIKELAPHAEEWEETTFPDSVFRRMGELGFLGLDKPEAYGGQGGDYYTSLVLAEEITNANSGGLAMGLAVQTDMAMPPILAFGTEEQKQQWAVPAIKGEAILCLGITEPDAGSDVSGIKTRAVRDGDEYVLNGTKIFCTGGDRAAKSEGFIVVWATVDKSAGRPGIKPFVVEHGTPGMTVVRTENKLGIRASDTAAIVFDNCRIPKDHLLGSPEVRKEGGFKDVMATFDATRPIVAAMAIGVGRAALDFVRDFLKQENIPVRYGISPRRLTALERDFMEMEVQLKAARLLTWRAAWMMDVGKHNNLEASMAKAKAGLAVTLITQKAVELLGPLGYSRQFLLEKWMRDAKINDIFEGTQQINMLIVARRILGYSSKELN